jgi:hypothetical protein
MALQIRRGTNAERLGITLVEGEVVYITDFQLTTISVTSLNASTNTLTTTVNHGLSVNDQVKFTGTTANGLTEGTVYYVKTIPSQTDFTLSTTLGGGTLDITGTWTADLVFATGPTDAAGTPYGYSISPLYVGDGITAGGNPAGASILDDLYDVEIGVYGSVGQYGKALADGHVLVYNDITNQWENTNIIATSVANDRLVVQYDNSSAGTNSALLVRKNYGATNYTNGDGVGIKFELKSDSQGDDEIAIINAINTSGGINIEFTTTVDDGANYTTPLRLNTNGSTFNSDLNITSETLSINSDNSASNSRIYFNGTNGAITYNRTSNFFDFGNSVSISDLYLSSGTVATGSGPLALNTPVGQSVNVQRDLVVGGNLTVNGTTTTVNSTTLTVDDKNIELASTASPSDATADLGGITLKGNTDKKIFWQNSDDYWYFDNGDGTAYRIPAFFTDLADVTITSAAKGDLLYYDGSVWVNDNKVQADTAAQRAVFQFNNDTTGLTTAAALFVRKNYTTPNAFANGDGTGIGLQLSNDNGAATTFAVYNAVYDASNPAFRLRTSTDGFASNDLTVASIDSTDVKFNGTNLVLNFNHTGAPSSNVGITVERGTSTDATITWNETDDLWVVSDTLYANNAVIGGTSIGTNGNDFYFNNDDGGTGATSSIIVKRGVNADIVFRWNETSDRWESTIDGTNYITLPNQGLDTGNTPTFAGATLGNIKVGVTNDNQIDTVSGDLTLDAPTTNINGSLVVTGSTTLGNGTGDTVTVNSGTINLGTGLTSTITLGDAAADTLTVNATSTFNNNLTVGSSDADTLTVNSTATFNNNLTIGSSSTDTLLVRSTAQFDEDVYLAYGASNTVVTVGNNASDEMYVNATTYINNNLTVGSTSGDTLTVNSQVAGNVEFTNNTTSTPRGVAGLVGTNDYWFVGGASAGTNDGYMVIATGDDGTEPIYVRQYTGNPTSGGSTITRTLTLLDASGNTAVPGNLTVTGDLTVNGTTTTLDTQNLLIEDNTILLNKNEVGAGVTAGTAGVEVERGSLANVTWQFNETNDWWEPAGPIGTMNIWATETIAAGGDLGTNANDIYFNYDNSGAGATSTLHVKRGSNPTVALRWNESTDRWQTTTDGTNYLNIPNQNLDTTDDATFSQVTVDGVSTYNSQSTTTTATTATAISSTTRPSQKAVIKAIDNVTGEVHMLEALAFLKGTTAYLTTYAEMYSNAALATFTADVSGGLLRILATPASTNSMTFTVARISLD